MGQRRVSGAWGKLVSDMDSQLPGMQKGAGMRDTYVHFPATPREVEEKRHLQFPEGFQVLTEPFSGELLQSILVALGRLLYFTFLVGGRDGKTQSWSAEQLREFGSTPFLLSLQLLLRVSPPKRHLRVGLALRVRQKAGEAWDPASQVDS